MIVLSEEGFVKVSDTKDIQPSHMKEVQVDGEGIRFVNLLSFILLIFTQFYAQFYARNILYILYHCDK
jgi:hypothetical protein